MKHRIIMEYPISANRYWTSFYATKLRRVVTRPTSESKEYRRNVASAVEQAGISEPIPGRVHVHLQLYPERPQDHASRKRKDPMNWDDDVRCLDLDNARKVVYDSLKGVLFEDDKWVWSDSAERMEPDEEGARCVVTIYPIERKSPQPSLFESTALTGPARARRLPIERVVQKILANTEAPF